MRWWLLGEESIYVVRQKIIWKTDKKSSILFSLVATNCCPFGPYRCRHRQPNFFLGWNELWTPTSQPQNLPHCQVTRTSWCGSLLSTRHPTCQKWREERYCFHIIHDFHLLIYYLPSAAIVKFGGQGRKWTTLLLSRMTTGIRQQPNYSLEERVLLSQLFY